MIVKGMHFDVFVQMKMFVDMQAPNIGSDGSYMHKLYNSNH